MRFKEWTLQQLQEAKIIIAVFMTMVICMVDLLTPLWYDAWVFYLFPLFFMFQAAKRPYVYSVIVTLLIAVGLFLPHSDNIPLMHAAVNRITGILGGWGVSFLLMDLKRMQISQRQANTELEKRVGDRTTEMFQANISLRKEIDERIQAEEALRASQMKYKAIFENVQDVYYQSDANGNFTEISPSILRYSGYTREELIGTPAANYYYNPEDRLTLLEIMKKNGEVVDYEARMKTKSGRLVIASINAHFLYDTTGAPAGMEGSLRDITDRKKTEKKIQEYSKDLEELISISREMTSTTDLKKLYRFSILSPKEFFEFDFSTLLILTKEKDRLTIADTLGFPEAVIGNFSLVEGQGLSTYVIQNKKAEGVTDLDAETRFEVPGIVREFGIHSAVCVPMMIQDEIIGALIGHTRVKRVFTAEDISIYQNIANHAAVAIKNAMNLEELKCLNEVLACQATTDPLTGIANRAKFSEVLESELARSNRFALPLSLIMFDIDQFKKINDTYGHNAGDDVLRELSAWVSKSVRKHDLFTRWGGEEFMIMFTNSTKSKATLYAEKLRLEIEALDFPQVGRVTCSFGVAEFEKDLTVDSLVQKADVALYRAKSAGRNRVEAN